MKAILHGKKELLSFKDSQGRPNVLRFLFSKWTLKEGWDNPNVFTICKLRSSGSEISKLQEVGRGLRLPVDCEGNRISDSSFMLNYIVDFTEKDFANKLVAEINGDLESQKKKPLEITREDMEKVALARNQNPFAFFSELGQKGYIDFHGVVVADRFDDLLREYPEFNDLGGGVDTTRIINRNSRRSDTVNIRKTQFEELRKLWNQLNRKFVLYLACDLDRSIEEALPQIIKDKHIFSLQTIQTTREELGFQAGVAYADEGAHTELTLPGRHLAYNDFLLRASRKTNITIHILHRAVCKVSADGCQITNEMFNEGSITRLITAIDDWKCRELSGLVRYKQANYRVKETKLTNPDGSVKDEVVQTFIGKKMVPGTPPAEYLYDAYAYDSGLELKNMQTRIED